MPTSQARIIANQINASKSTGPKTAAGKEQSRRNSYKHGMTGAGVVLSVTDAAEVDRRADVYAEELDVETELGEAVSRRLALSSVRMERGAKQQTASLTKRLRQVDLEFVAPEGADAETIASLRAEAAEAAEIAMFDHSKEAALARQYEAAAERAFYRALKELRQMTKDQKRDTMPVSTAETRAMMGSFGTYAAVDAEMDALYADLGLELPPDSPRSPRYQGKAGGIDVPFAIGRPH